VIYRNTADPQGTCDGEATAEPSCIKASPFSLIAIAKSVPLGMKNSGETAWQVKLN
jgi:hypothetical protein